MPWYIWAILGAVWGISVTVIAVGFIFYRTWHNNNWW